MSKVEISTQGMRDLIKIVGARLHEEVEEEIIPFAKFHVRVDTGRLRESIKADVAKHDLNFQANDGESPATINAVVVVVNLGGTPQYPTARIDSLGNRLVDYAIDLEDNTRNLSHDIFDGLQAIYV